MNAFSLTRCYSGNKYLCLKKPMLYLSELGNSRPVSDIPFHGVVASQLQGFPDDSDPVGAFHWASDQVMVLKPLWSHCWMTLGRINEGECVPVEPSWSLCGFQYHRP